MNAKLAALAAELRVIEAWDRARQTAAPDSEVEARRLRRVEILAEIDALVSKASREMFFRA